MATPTYQGQGQPSADDGGGWLGRLGAYFGSASAPAYAPAPAPTVVVPPPKPSGDDGGTTVMRPTTIGTIDPDALAAGQIAIVVPRLSDDQIPIDPDALASGQVAIVVRRGTAITP